VNNNDAGIPIACDLTAIPADAREQHIDEGLQILQAAEEVQELPNGYAYRFANKEGEFMALANFVENERRCCPFYAFVIEVEPGGGALWLRMTGGEGVKEFEQAIFADVNEAIRTRRINTGGEATLDAAVVQSVPALAGLVAQTSESKG
jgi:hypothetical protein